MDPNPFYPYISSLSTTLFGVFLAYALSKWLQKQKENEAIQKQKDALFENLYEYKDTYSNHFNYLVKEYKSPSESMQSLPYVYFKITEHLLIQLGSNIGILTKDQVRLVYMVMHIHDVLIENQKLKDEPHNKLILNKNLSEPEIRKYESNVKLYTSIQIIHLLDVLFYILKYLETKDNFTFDDFNHTYTNKMKMICQFTETTISDYDWHAMKNQTGFHIP